MKKVSAVFYGINGTGLGHISRLLNIAREARELLHAMDLGADFEFITTSEAPQAGWDFPVYKLPSKTVIVNMDTNNDEFFARSQFFITNLVAQRRPDLLVLDTMPQGSFGEFVQLRPHAKRRVFINRHKDEEQATSAVHQSHLPLYDLLLTPDDRSEERRYIIPHEVQNRNVYTGKIQGFRSEEALSRQEARDHFGIDDHQTVIYISAGGGGDKQAEQDLSAIIAVASMNPNHTVLVGYGPLYRGKKVYRQNVIPITDCDVRQFFKGIDLAFSAAGYNTYEELLSAGVPTAFYAQAKGMDRQDERVDIGVKNRWHIALRDFDQISIEDAIVSLKKEKNLSVIRNALKARNQSNGALSAALELLKLHASLKHSPIRLDQLYVAAAMRKAWPDVYASCELSGSLSREVFTQAARHMIEWQSYIQNAVAQQSFFDDARRSWEGEDRVFGRQLADSGLRLVRYFREGKEKPSEFFRRMRQVLKSDRGCGRHNPVEPGVIQQFIASCGDVEEAA